MARSVLRALAAASAAAAAAAAHVECSLDEQASGAATCDAAEPAWLKYFSVAAAGPEQIFLNFGNDAGDMVVGWATADTSADSLVEWGAKSGAYTHSARGTSETYTYSAKYTSPLLHHATMTNLAAKTRFYYRVGTNDSWSQEYSFVSNAVGADQFPYVVGVFADLGESNNAVSTVAHLLSSKADSLLLVGDMSYASGCEKNGCTTWDAFQRMLAPLSATVPTHVELGNHEYDDVIGGVKGASARYRFSGMPGQGADNLDYFGWDAGPAHFISLASFYPSFSASSGMTKWLTNDLQKVDRSVTPWIIVEVHAPWYNSNTQHTNDGSKMQAAYESLFQQYGVSIVVAGHVHAYERSCPVFKGKCVADGEAARYFTSGDGGASLYTKWIALPEWSEVRLAQWGHGEITLHNATWATWNWVRNADNEPDAYDSVDIKNVGL